MIESKETETKKEEPKAKAKEKKEKAEPEMVEILIPQIPGEAKEMTFGINGVFTKVRKGRLVKVPRPIAKLWENSQRQTQTAEETQERLKEQRQDL